MGNNKNKWDGKNPWLGLQTYQEGVRLWGRDTEVLTLTDIICNNLATVVFGKSGIGKSSLIHAGVSPEIRKRSMMPIYIRLEHNSSVSYISQIVNAVENALTKKDLLGATNPPMGLWDFFHRHIFYNKENQETFPVIIIDQFEEIYTLADADHKQQAQDLFEEFADLLNNKKPEKVMAFEHEAMQFKKSKIEIGRDNVLTFRIHSEKRNSYIEDSNFRVVICLREDYLYYLERNTSKIPSLKINRFSLQALDRPSACEVIMQPQPGLFSSDEANNIISKISTFNDEGKEEIDPTILSIFLFKYFNSKGNVSTENIISEFYTDETKNISSASLAYLEDHLITGEGFRHFSPYNDALSSGVTKQELNQLIASRILTVETRKGHRYIEFSHDIICPIAKSNREQRKIDEQARKLRKRILAATGLVFLALIIIAIFLQQGYVLQKNKHSLQVSLTKNASIRAHYMTVQGDVLDAVKLLLNIVPKEEGQAILPETEKALNEAYDSLYSDFSCIAILNHFDDVTTAEFSTDSKCIITASNDGICRLWNGLSGELKKELKCDIKEMTGASLDSEGKRVIASFGNGTVLIWDVMTGEILTTLKGHAPASVSYACFSPDGKYALTSSVDKTVKLWDAKTGEYKETIIEHQDNVNCAIFSTDGKKVISASEDGSSMLFDFDTRTTKVVYQNDNVSVEYAEFNFDNTKIAIVTNDAVYVIDVETSKTDAVLKGHNDFITSATFSPDGRTIATSSRDKTIKLWDISTGKELHTYTGHSNVVRDVVFSPDGKFILSTSFDNEARLWNVCIDDRPDVIKCKMGVLTMLTYSPDGKYIAAISVMGKAKIWDAKTMDSVSSFEIPDMANSISFSDKSDLVIVTSESNTLRVYDIASGNLVDSIETDSGTSYANALFTNRDKSIIAYSDNQRTICWDFGKHSFKYLNDKEMDSLTCMTMMNDTTYLLAHANKNALSIWNPVKKKTIKVFSGHTATVSYVSCNYHGERIASGSSDNTMIIWDIASTNIIHKMKKHSRQVYFTEFSPDDCYVITASTDETIKLWNTETGAEVSTRKNTLSPKYGIMFKANAHNYITSPNGEDIRIYKLLPPNEIVQNLTTRYDNVLLTNEEKDYYSLK